MMLGSLDISLQYNENSRPNYNMGFLFYGWLMEIVDNDFAEKAHQQGLKPYSQYITCHQGEAVWHIRTLNEEAYQRIIVELQNKQPDTINIKSKGIEYQVKEIREGCGYNSYKDLADIYYLEKPAARNAVFRTETPVSFRSDNQYQLFPKENYIFQNLVNRWNAFADTVSLEDADTLLVLSTKSHISRYRLESTLYNLGEVKIPSFRGVWEMRFTGADTLARLGGMLADYSQFAGLGIKTALGMGGISCADTSIFRRGN